MRNRNIHKRILSLLLITIVSVSLLLGSFQKAVATESEDQLEDVNRQEEEAETERAMLERQIEEQQAEVSRLSALVSEKQAEIDAKQQEIDDLTARIEEQRKSISERKEGLGNRLRSMYKNGTVGFVDVLLSSNSFSELLSNLSMVQEIFKCDQETLETLEIQYEKLKEDMELLAKAKEEMEAAKAQLETDLQSAAIAEAELEDSLAYVQAKLEELAAEREELEAIIAEEQRQAAAAGYAYSGGSGSYIWPVSGPITYGFGYRSDAAIAAVGGSSYHEGIDIGVPTGTPVVASASGTVSYATGWSGGYGYAVFINHPDGSTTVYGHNSSLAVSGGEWVEQGQLIAYAGSTGWSTGPHVHFEIRIDGVKVNPIGYL